jgi:hypothetical protein
VSFITPKDEAKDYDDSSYFQSAPAAALGPIPGDPRPSGSAHPTPPPYQGPSSLAYPPSDDPPQDLSYEEEMVHAFFADYPP